MIRNTIKKFNIYRFNPEANFKPYYETFEINLSKCGPMMLDALLYIKNKILH